MKRTFILRAAIMLLLVTTTMVAWAQTYSVSYDCTDSEGYTCKPDPPVPGNKEIYYVLTSKGEKWLAYTVDKDYNPVTWIKAKAIIINNTSIYFFAYKNSGTFNNGIIMQVRKDVKISNGKVTNAGTVVKSTTGSAGSQGAALSLDPDFTSGTHTYTITLISGSYTFYTTPIRVSAETPESPNLTIINTDYFGNTNLTLNTEYDYSVRVKNTGSSSWTGRFYLKSSGNNLISWETPRTIEPGKSAYISGSYAFTSTGTKSVGLYYKTETETNGDLVKPGDFSNPFNVTVTSATPNLVLASTGSFGTTTLTKGTPYKFSVKVKNNGSSSWSGAFYLKYGTGDTNWLSWSKTIGAGQTETLEKTYTPTKTGNYTLTLYYQTGGTGEGSPVPQGSYSNPIYVTVVAPLDTPDNSTFDFVPGSITTNSFTAKWGAVSGATKYNINVKKVSDKEYNSSTIVFSKKGITSTSCNVDENIAQGTSYHFQIQAADNNGQTSSWSSSSKPITTLTALTIINNTFFGSYTLTKGQTASFTTKIRNNGSETWKGRLYLKPVGTTNNWIKTDNVISIAGNSTFTFDGSYTPTQAGAYDLGIYYLTEGETSGDLVNAGNYQNHFTVTVVAPLATPDNSTFGFVPGSITTTGFTATWGAVSGATKYGILVRKVGGSYTKDPKFEDEVTSTSCNVTGLEPETSYEFQIQARNSNGQTSDWSSSILTPITTLAATPENTTYTANPSSGWTEVPEPDKTIGSIIYHGGLLQAQATISGSTATFTLKKNDGSQFNNDGSIMVFYGSLGGTIIKSSTYYGGVRNLSIDIKLDFISGSKKYIIAIISGKTFYYTNPITITANGSSTDVDLVIADGSLFFNTEILTTGYGHTFNVKVKNNGSTTWKGHFFLKRGKGTPNLLSWYDVEINAGETKALIPKTYKPEEAGRKSLTLFYQTGGSGDGVPVSAGNYDNPFVISVVDPPTLSAPNKSTLIATNPTETGFTAKWGAVSGATKYRVCVYKAGTNNLVDDRTVSTTWYDVTGLTPNTSYQFKIMAKSENNSQSSNWSELSDVITTKRSGTVSANISIHAVRGFDGKTPLTVGVPYNYRVYVINNGASDWKGSFYLKEGTNDLEHWDNLPLSKNAGGFQILDYTYIPESAGTKEITLYYQTNTSGDDLPVNAGNGTNPMKVNVISSPTVYDGLKLKSAIVYPQTLELGQKATISAEVQNTGDTDCNVFFTDNNAIISNPENVSAGKTKTIKITNWEPQTSGAHSIAVYYKASGGSGQQLVAANGFANPITIEVVSANVDMASHEVNVYHITKDVAPKTIPAGAKILYHFRITNKNDIPVKGFQGKFDVTVTSTTGSKQNYSASSDPSGDNGVIFLALNSSDWSNIINAGGSAVIQCKKIFKNVDEYTILNKSTLEPITLSVKDNALFSKIQEFKITLDVGVSGKLSAGKTALITDPLSDDKELASLKGSLALPVSYTLKKNDEGKISKIGIESGINGKLDAALNIGDWLSFDTEGYIGAKAKNTFSTDDKRAIWMAVANGYEAIRYHTNSMTLIAVRAFCNWFHQKPIEVETSKSWFVGYSVGASANLSKAFPTIHSKLLKKLSLPSSFWFDDENLFKVGAKATAKWEPDKYKTVDINNKKYDVYGEGRSLKLKMDNFLTSRVPAYFLAQKSYWNGDLANKYFSHYGLDVFFVSSKAKLSGAFTIKEEEFYTDSKKQNLYSISNNVEISTSDEIKLEDVPYLGPWLKEGGLKAGLTSTVTLSSKLESKGDFARYLQNTSNTLQGANLSKIFPALSGKSIIGAPRAHFEAFSEDLIGTIRQLHTGNKEFPLEEALKLEQKVKNELEASVSIPFHPGVKLQWTIDARLAFECESYPSETYYSVKDKQFIPVVLQPSSSIANELDGLIGKINDRLNNSFNSTERKEIDDRHDWELQSSKYGPGYVAGGESELTLSYDDTHYVLQNASWANARIKRLHPRLVPEKQNDICKMSFILNEDGQSFDSDVSIDFGHYYPAGELLGITDQGETLFVVSEVCYLRANNDLNTLDQVQHGNMRIETTIGIDDLTPFGFSEDTPLDVYYSEDGQEDVWHYLGPAGTTIMTDRMGKYMMATSITNDVLLPEIEAKLYDDLQMLHLHVSDNIGIRTNSLRVYINGEARDITMLSESDFEVQLSDQDMEYMMTIYITVNDLAGNQGRFFQTFNIDKPDPNSIMGDVNGDGEVDITDAIMIVYHSLGLEQEGFNASVADVNGDRKIDITDAIIVVYKSLGAE